MAVVSGMKIFFLGVILLVLILPVWGRSAELTVAVCGLRSEGGRLCVALFDSAKGFPSDASQAIVSQSLDLATIPRNQPVTLVFKNLAEKRYAISVFHDEDFDGKLKTNWLGIPKEGVGVSNNARGRLGPPKYEAATFDLKALLRISVTVSYW